MFASKSEREVLSVGVDYLTATARSKRSRQVFQRIGTVELHKERSAGCEVGPFRLFDLEGLRAGSVEYATSRWYDMLRISSHVADERWLDVVQVAENISRIDLQVTVRLTPAQPNLAEHVERSMKRFKASKHTRLEIELRRNDVKGKTLYTGSRKSDLFSRLYDKGRESRLPELEGCWRLESQYMNAKALAHAKALSQVGDSCSAIYGLIAGYYRDRGAPGIIPALMVPPLTVYGLRRSEAANSPGRKLEWLRSQVRPFVQAQRQLGNLPEILDALGLNDLMVQHMDHDNTEE